MTMTLTERKGLLLALAGPAHRAPDASVIERLDDDDWLAIDEMAAQHRLLPWLHHRNRSGKLPVTVPPAIADRWKETYRDAAIGALTAQAALVRLATAFGTAGVPMVALKGSRLAFFDYPEAALRPMRDIDILVAPERLAEAVDAMADAGCIVPADRDAAIARALDGDKHLDAIELPDCQRFIELHHRIAEPGLPCIPTGDILSEARTDRLGGAAVAFPSSEHMLGHLVLHAVYNHRFDCGPLALVDIGMLLANEAIAPPRFVALAEAGGWLPGARLVLALVDRFMGPTGLDIGQGAVPGAIIAESESLLLQDFEQRQQVLLASQSANAGLAATVVARLRRGLSQPSAKGRLRWILSRANRTIRQASDPRARSEAAAGASLARWLGRDAAANYVADSDTPSRPQDEG